MGERYKAKDLQSSAYFLFLKKEKEEKENLYVIDQILSRIKTASCVALCSCHKEIL